LADCCWRIPLFILLFWYSISSRELLTTGFINAVGVFQTYYEQNQLSELSAFQIGWLASFLAFFLNMGVIIFFTGTPGLMEGCYCWTHVRHFWPTMVTHGWNCPHCFRTHDDVVMSRILAVLPRAGHYHRRWIIISVPTGPKFHELKISFQTSVLCINTWFLKKRGLAMGITVAGSSFGGVCFPIILKRLFDSVGFGWAVRTVGFLIFGCLVIANFLVRSRLSPPGWMKGRQIFDFAALKEPIYCLVVVCVSF
jgi:hypothetical protein